VQTLLSDLLDLSDFAGNRLKSRVAGLTDDEYFWEPVPDCWTVHKDGDGFRIDASPLPPEPAPFTTLAWRLAHIADVLQAERTATWLRVEPVPSDGTTPVPGSAAAAVEALDHAYAVWRRRLSAVDPAVLDQSMGEIAGPYAGNTVNSFVLHILDELIHHGAEVGVVRDLYRQHETLDPFVQACLLGDLPVMQEVDPAQLERTRAEHPDLLARAAARQRWDVVRLLAEHGFDVYRPGAGGVTAAHRPAGAGQVDVLRMLVDSGADLAATDIQYGATPFGVGGVLRAGGCRRLPARGVIRLAGVASGTMAG
jgi:hypothetical protein